MTETTWAPPSTPPPPPTGSNAHDVAVQAHSDGYWYATCRTCGWASRPCSLEKEATIEAGQHHQAVEVPTRAPARSKPRVGKWVKRAVLAGFAIWITAAVVGSASDSPSSSAGSGGGPSTDDLRYGAFDVCTQYVEDRLKAPATAKFRNPYESDGEVVIFGSGEGGSFTVTSSVDAQNGFGAQIRTGFTCRVEHVAGERWSLLSLTLDD